MYHYVCMYVCRVPTRNPLQNQCLPTSRIMFVCVYDQAGFPQGEFRPGSLPATKITTREPTHKQNHDQAGSWLAGWLASGITTREPVMHRLAGWLAGGLAGWLSEAQRAPRRPREAHRSGAWIEQACDALGWRLPRSSTTTNTTMYLVHTSILGSKRPMVTPSQKVASVISNSHVYGEALPSTELASPATQG